ncbi:MAG TPA: malto-oligosyltrehalose trehalohydrolase [Streptosporangiaceae bacterium]|nr:malto-oligosyltrehalose trehalohydrolase [Streptosporangiaceae bacterium]
MTEDGSTDYSLTEHGRTECGTSEFRVWAPAASRVQAEVAGRLHEMSGSASGWWTVAVPDADPQALYAFCLDGGVLLPDPRSLRQPAGPDGPSQRYDQAAFTWSDAGWRGIPLPGSVFYELHIGTFTAGGTFDAAIKQLDHLADLGVTTIELMPVAAFPGRRGWGYDGIGLWAVHEPYGGPDGLKRFVDACHARGLAVVLDVVYNHVGAGNRLADFGPYFTDVHATPWGPAVNLDQPGADEVRAFIVANALMWLRDYHLDGLRLDAVHALADRGAVHLLEQLATDVHALGARLNRLLVLIAESDANDPRLVTSQEAGGYGLDAQWNDDFHHAVHAAVTGERQGYYGDFGSMAALAKTMTRVFFHDGTWSSFRGRSHGRAVDLFRVPGYRFVGYLQDHDQVGNRATGDRIAASLPADLLRVGAGLVLTAPFTPMVFMGEEWGALTPWQYFTDYQDAALGQAVAAGRRAEFAQHGWLGEVPDPQDETTFERSRLNWADLHEPRHLDVHAWYRALIELRRREPELTDPDLSRIEASWDEAGRWLLVCRGPLRVVANLGPDTQRVPLDAVGGQVLLSSAAGVATIGDALSMPPASFAVVRM